MSLLLIASTSVGVIAVLAFTDLPLLFVALSGIVLGGAQFGVRTATATAAWAAIATAVWLVFEDGVLMLGMSDGTALVILKLKLLVFAAAGLVVAAEVAERIRASLLAVVQSQRVIEEHDIVERLQRLLLPAENLTGSSFEASGRYWAGAAELGVGGDWYEVEELEDKRVFISVGDIVGRGAEAATIMSRLRAIATMIAADSASAAEVLERMEAQFAINRAFATTVWMGLYDPATRHLSYASAGHPPAFLIWGDNVTRLEQALNPPLAVDPRSTKLASAVTLASGARLVLYTDGLVERRGETIDVGLDRIERTLVSMTGSDIEPGKLAAALQPESATDQPDDDTIIVVVRFH